MNKKYQVFISSTYEDLKEHRDQVVKAVLQMGHLPVGMEMFNAGDQTQWQTIQRHIDHSDYYVVLLAHRYGTKDPASGLSYTEQEYDYAGQQGIPRLGFVIEKGATWPANLVETKARKKLDDFKSKVGHARVIRFWDTPAKLAFEVFASLSNEISLNPRIGWVRATEAASPQVAEELARLSRENKELQTQLSDAQRNDKADPLEQIILNTVITSKKNAEVQVSLRLVFFGVCLNQPTTPKELLEMEAIESMYETELKESMLNAIESALDELKRLGVVSSRIHTPGQGPEEFRRIMARQVWELTDNGSKLYASLWYANSNNYATLPPLAPSQLV